MKNIYSIILLLAIILWSSCRSDFDFTETSGRLVFSRDTVFLDTVFSNISSATYTLKVYNRSGEDVFVPEVNLRNGENSYYRLNVDGLSGKSFENIEILAKDSIYIFIETTVDAEDFPEEEFLYTDALQFRSSGHLQEVPLVTLIKDAVLLYPQKGNDGKPGTVSIEDPESGEEILVPGFFLEEEQLVFTNEKPYVIYGFAVVPSQKDLKIEAGARIYFHANSGLLISENASLQVDGIYSEDRQQLENEVIFEADRQQKQFENVPGQWSGIRFKKGSKKSHFKHTTIKNAGIGVWISGDALSSPVSLELQNVQIYNSAVNGLRLENADIYAENLVINNSGQSSLHIIGGNHEYTHCTIANYWQKGYRQFPSVLIENVENSSGIDLQKANFYNSIIYGNDRLELFFNKTENSFNVFFQNCLIRFQDEQGSFNGNPLYDFSNEEIFKDVLLNQDPIFKDPLKNQLMLTETSPVVDQADPEKAASVPLDLLQHPRLPEPDIGAYEFVPPVEENSGN
ncbi:hypothetical protein [Salinimicrobium soli]|uniref:hypothetical protein n=1 Tax=Salinimicrobium soli TaxID=1254399 RepID=UPI003AAD77A0